MQAVDSVAGYSRRMREVERKVEDFGKLYLYPRERIGNAESFIISTRTLVWWFVEYELLIWCYDVIVPDYLYML